MLSGRGDAVRRREVPVRPEQFALRPLGPMRGDEKGMRRTEREAPAGRWMAMRNLQHGPVEGRDVELVAAEHARLQRAIKAGVEERLVQFLRIEAPFVVFRLLLAQQQLERCRARD